MGCNCKNKRKTDTSRVFVNASYLTGANYTLIENALKLHAPVLTEQQIESVIDYLKEQKSIAESSNGGFRLVKTAKDSIYTGPTTIATAIWQMLTRNGIYSRLSNVLKQL